MKLIIIMYFIIPTYRNVIIPTYNQVKMRFNKIFNKILYFLLFFELNL